MTAELAAVLGPAVGLGQITATAIFLLFNPSEEDPSQIVVQSEMMPNIREFRTSDSESIVLITKYPYMLKSKMDSWSMFSGTS